MIVGDQGVGKTTLIDAFREVDESTGLIRTPSNVNERSPDGLGEYNVDWIGHREIKYGDVSCMLKVIGIPATTEIDKTVL